MVRRARRTAALITAAVAATVALPACSAGPRTATGGGADFSLSGVSSVTPIGQVSGAESPGDTTQYAVNFTDLGSMFEHNGKVWFVFGDTFGERDPGFTGGGGSLWRSNALGWTTDDDPSDGITIEGMIVDETSTGKELLESKKIDNDEMTVIPTHGFAANDAMYLHYMSVAHWAEPGEWEVNEAGLAKSTDEGQTWIKLDEPRWDGESGFVQISPYSVDENGVDTLYVWGITHGRFGGVSLAKVPTSDVESADSWRYFTGADDDGEPQWGENPADAVLVLDDTVGELSVVWNDYLGNWLMTYLAEGRGIVLREGLTPWGPWGDEQLLVGATEVPGPYAPYMLDRYTDDGGRVIYFTLSIWDPYNVFWYRAELEKS